ncbi:MAG: discoidin domain-containing protein, partial [Thermoanaerobaculia bacterium]
MRRLPIVLILSLLAVTPLSAAVLDDFDDVSDWIAAPSDGVELRISSERGAMRLDFDFYGGAGYAIARKPVKLQLPSDYEFTFRMRGEAPPNTLEFKLLDPSGDNVWWLNQRNRTFPRAWTKQRILKRHIEFAWGPSGGAPLTEISALEIVITASTGGKGTIWIDDLVFHEREARPANPPEPHGPWRGREELLVDFGTPHEFGGMTLEWERHASDYNVEMSLDRQTWEKVATVRGSTGGRDPLFLPDSDARYVRVRMPRGSYSLKSVTFEPLAFGASRNAFFTHIAGRERRGLYPRYFMNEQSYWTIVGEVGEECEALLNEDGALEL